VEVSPKSRKRAAKEPPATAAFMASEYDYAVMTALKKWRREKSAQLGVPAFVIFADRTLQELARMLPESPADLLNVRGIGPAKARQFGQEALAVIAKAKLRDLL
jgi:ATP-dependent DNA helicase RecQ